MSPNTHDEVRLVVGGISCELVFVPAGTFLMGTNAERAPAVASQFPGVQPEWILKEAPAHEVYLPDYHIARTPITNQLWAEYMNRTSSLPPPNWADSPPDPKAPCLGHNVRRGRSFLSLVIPVLLTILITLPTEAQWEKAARGVDGREWPWGNEFSAEKCNTREGGYGGLTAVNRFPAGASPYGALDMGGNVEEWTSGLYRPYPGGEVATNGFGGPGHRVTRGGHWEGRGDLARCARRHGAWAHSRVGARMVLNMPVSGSSNPSGKSPSYSTSHSSVVELTPTQAQPTDCGANSA